MGSLAAVEEDEAANRRSRPPPPSRSSQQRLLFPPTQPPEIRIRETVINGTTWYHPPLQFNSDSHVSSARYSPFPSFDPVNCDGQARSLLCVEPNQPYPDNGGAFGNRGLRPQVNVIPGGCASGYMADYIHGAALHGTAHGGFPGYPYPGMNSMYGPMPGYSYNGQPNQGMPFYPYDAHARPYIPPADASYTSMPMPNFGSMQGPARAPHGGYVTDHTSHGMPPPPYAVRTTGKTLRQIVTWSGMTMPVTVTSQSAAIVEWIQRQTGDLFGFDLEWKPNRLKDEDNLVALLQICGPTDCLIIQLFYTDMIPKMLRDFLFNSKKRLGGVGIRQDVAKLERDHDLACQGQVELGALASEKLKRDDLQGRGLKRLVEQVLGMTLMKVKKITMSNWEKEYLDEKQIEYACIDAWAAYAILHKLMNS